MSANDKTKNGELLHHESISLRLSKPVAILRENVDRVFRIRSFSLMKGFLNVSNSCIPVCGVCLLCGRSIYRKKEKGHKRLWQRP